MKFYKGNDEYREPHPRSDMIPPSKRIMVFSLRYLTESEHQIIDTIWNKHRTLSRYKIYIRHKEKERKTVSCSDIKGLHLKHCPECNDLFEQRLSEYKMEKEDG